VTIAHPAAGQVLVRLYAAGVNPYEAYIRSGSYASIANTPKDPYTPGFDGAGVVEEVGAGVTHFKKGDRVWVYQTLTGVYAQHTLVLEKNVHHLPESLSFSQGAALGVPYCTAVRALLHKSRSVLQRKRTTKPIVLIHGASGGVGTAAVQIAKDMGFIVIGTASTEESSKVVLQEGGSYVFNHKENGYLEKIKEVKEVKENQGVDLILEMLAGVNLGHDLELIAKFGVIVIIGARGTTVPVNPGLTMGKEVEISGMALYNASEEEFQEIYDWLQARLGKSIRPIIGKELPLKDAPTAHHEIMETRALGKIILLPHPQ